MNKLISFSIITIILFSLILDSKAQQLEDKDSDCILCTQMVPMCKPDEKLVLQTCKRCAHCEPVEEKSAECVKCRFNFDCITGCVCKNECCTERSLKTKGLKAIQKIIDKKDSIPGCKNPCGIKCCNHRQKCIVIDQCKERKTKCSLPVLKYCSTKVPEPINGRLHPL